MAVLFVVVKLRALFRRRLRMLGAYGRRSLGRDVSAADRGLFSLLFFFWANAGTVSNTAAANNPIVFFNGPSYFPLISYDVKLS